MHSDSASDPGSASPRVDASLEQGEVAARLERELRQSHQRFQAILDTTSDGYWRVQVETGRITEVNDAYCRVIGYSRAELLGMSIGQLEALDSEERIRARSEQVEREGTIRFESQHRAKDGQLLDFEVSLTLVPSTHEVVAFFRNLTEQKRAQAALAESEGRFQALAQHSWDILSILDAEGRLLYNSPACERIHGFTPEELLGRSTMDLIHPDDAPRVTEAMGRLMTHSGEPVFVEYRYACKDGHWVWMEAVGANYLEDPAIRGIVANSRDITERKRAEEFHRAAEAMYRELLERQGEGFGVVDAGERFLLANPVAETIFGLPSGGLVGRSLLDFLEEPARKKIQDETRTRHTGLSNTYELEIRRPSGERRTILVTATPRPAAEGHGLQVIGVFRDITEERLAALEREQYFKLFMAASDLMVIADPLGCFKQVNPAVAHTLGWSEEEILAKPFLDFIHPDDRQETADEMARQMQIGFSLNFENRYLCKDGSYRWLSWQAVYVEAEGITYATGRDVTELRKANRALQDEKERLSQIFHGSHDAIYLSDLETGRYLDVNDAFERITGYSRDQAMAGNSMNRNLWFDPADRQAYYEELQAHAMVRNRLIRIRHQEGREVWAECNSSLMVLGGRPCMVSTARDVTERIHTEAALKESERSFQRLLEVASVPIGVANGRGEIEYLNPRFLQDLKYSREDLPTMEAWWTRAYPDPDYRKQAMNAWAEAQERAASRGGEVAMDQVFQITCGDGQARLVEIRGAIAGRRVIVFLQDLTERIKAEGALRDALELSDRMLTSQPIGVLAYHAASGRCVRANGAMGRMVGGSVEQLLSQNFRELDSWKTSGLLAVAEQTLATGMEQRADVHIRSTFGTECWMSVVINTFQAGGDTHLLMLSEDITARKAAEVALSKATAAVEQSPAAIVITDTQGTIEYVNAAFTQSTGYSFEEAIGQNPRILKSGKQMPEVYQELWNTVLAGGTWRGQFCNCRKDGSLFWEQATISPLRDETGVITHLVASKLDITQAVKVAEEHRKLEEQVARTQKLESLGSLAGGVAHDMNNVLGAILGLASIHQEIQPEGSALRRDMDTIVKACQRGGTLVKGLLGFARKGLAEAEDVDLNTLVRDEVALLSRTTLQRVQLVTDLAEGLPLVRGDASALSHALMNLCVNAVDAMAGGGTLTLRSFLAEPGFVGLEVVDTGCGMPKDVQDKALDPFFTTKPQGKGTGLGLPIVYGTVKAHQGRMEIDSVVGQGTRVSLFLPALETAATPSVPALIHDGNIRALDVFVVDDDELIRSSVVQLLEALGHHATVATSGEDALAQLRAGLCTDLVILDLNMPGMGGAAALPLIRAMHPELPILLATGRVDQEALNLAQQIPLVSLMPKPFSFAEIKQQLQPFCGKG